MSKKNPKYFHEGEFSIILKLIKNNRIETAQIQCENYLAKYPYDVCAYGRYADILMRLGKLEEAEEVLNFVPITNKTPDISKQDIVYNKMKLYIYLKQYEKSLEILRENYDALEERGCDVTKILIFLKKQLGLLMCDNYTGSGYKIEQITNYSETSALECIRRCHCRVESEPPFCFNKDFPLEETFYKIRQMLPLEKKQYENIIENVYYFKYENNGRCQNVQADYIKVYTIVDTADIITMFPINIRERILCPDITPEIETKVKRISPIDKFNKRYGR